MKHHALQKAIATAFLAGASIGAHAHLISAVNMMKCDLILIDADTDQIIVQSLKTLPNWPDAVCQHSWITPDKQKVFISTDANQNIGAKVAALRINSIDWSNKTASVTLENLIAMGPAGKLSSIPVPKQVSPNQPIPPVPSAWFPTYSQIHGPSLLPGSDFSYLTGYTDSNIYVINNTTNQLVRTQNFGFLSRQTHGINFNPSGTLGLGAPYQFDLNQVDVYRASKLTGAVALVDTIPLGNFQQYAAFAHFTFWVDDRYAFIGTMQADNTSFTPVGSKVMGPSVWRLDTTLHKAVRVLGTTDRVDGTGVYRPASDVAVVGNTLIVAEEDTLDGSVGPGYIAFFDITDINQPRLIKRMVPGVDLPDDFKVAHVISVPDDKSAAYVSSYYSNYILKLDIANQRVLKVFSSADGLDMPHGEFISGNIR